MRAAKRSPVLGIFRKLSLSALITLGVLVIVATGGGDGDGSISVRNFDDNHTYWVGLYEAGKTDTTQSTILGKYSAPEEGSTDTFENVPEGDYFIIFKIDTIEGEERKRTGNFRLDDGEWKCFSINEDGKLQECG